jgi:beta-xylosidase
MQALLPLAGKSGFAGIRNVLTQRSARSAKAEVTVKMDLAGLADGEEAGLAHFSRDYCRLAVAQTGGVRKVVRIDQGKETAGPVVTTLGIWLRSTWSEEGMARFSYSLDGSAFTEIGSSYRLSWGSYRGDRIGLYTVNGTMERGYADFSDFRYRVE